MTINTFPVKSSLPAISTIAIPAGKIIAAIRRPGEVVPKVVDAVVAATPAKDINMPAKKPRRIILNIGSFVL